MIRFEIIPFSNPLHKKSAMIDLCLCKSVLRVARFEDKKLPLILSDSETILERKVKFIKD